MLLAYFKKFILLRAEQSIMTAAGLFKMVFTLAFIYLDLQLLYASAFEAPNRRTMWPKQIFCSVRKGYPKISIVDLSAQTRFK